jgi:predicted enzyme related to lactoylglutathione lyase
MPKPNRRKLLRVGLVFVALPSSLLHLGCSTSQDPATVDNNGSPDRRPETNEENKKVTANDEATTDHQAQTKANSMQVQYLEIVTPDVDALCTSYSQMHGVTFNDADPSLGGARTAKLGSGGTLGIRAPMRETEKPVVRPYMLVSDIKAAVEAAEKNGAEIAIPPMEIPGHGTFAIVIQGGIESGLWQV